jgi:RNA polymerase sigma-70 factor (ECF subfamily)
MAAAPGFTLHESTVNGQPGLVARFEGRPVSVLAFDIEGGRIRGVWAVLNPDKLRLWQTG